MKLKIAAVKYINTLPFLRGIEKSEYAADIDIILESPAQCAALLKQQDVDIALIPVGSLADFEHIYILPEYCIGSEQSVGTVVLASNSELKDIHTIYLDPSSRTSNILIQILCKDKFEITYNTYEHQILKSGEARVAIGDKVFGLKSNYTFIYDLGSMWREQFNLPLVYAVWAYTDKAIFQYKDRLLEMFAHGIQSIPEIINEYKSENHIDYAQYFEEHLSFYFDNSKKRSLDIVLQYLQKDSSEIYMM